jgi:hypothetical protein
LGDRVCFAADKDFTDGAAEGCLGWCCGWKFPAELSGAAGADDGDVIFVGFQCQFEEPEAVACGEPTFESDVGIEDIKKEYGGVPASAGGFCEFGEKFGSWDGCGVTELEFENSGGVLVNARAGADRGVEDESGGLVWGLGEGLNPIQYLPWGLAGDRCLTGLPCTGLLRIGSLEEIGNGRIAEYCGGGERKE